ncbi:MAG: Fic family protein [Alphaproteobacteria bacterium]|nr:Fic family protein [Alphaproteobacteria bacterium]
MKKWNWQLKDWPNFTYNKERLTKLEADFLHSSGVFFGIHKHLNKQDKESLRVELLSDEALKTSEIEGEILNRDSLQSSIRRNFGLITDRRKIPPSEKGISDVMVDLYKNSADKLNHESLFRWHKMITNGRYDLQDIGRYRTHEDAMQIVSGNIYDSRVHFEAPLSKNVKKEMNDFVDWFNKSEKKLPALTRAGIAHFYFVTIHPFEDGNGRIARALAIKALSQSLNRSILTSLSTIIQKNKRKYYDALQSGNQSIEIGEWLEYFAKTFLESQTHTQNTIEFLIRKTQLYATLRDQLNERQEKILAKMFNAGLEGFKGGLSAENYITITKTSRATATRDLQDLVEKGALIRTGEFKGVRYSLNLKPETK